ncbi:bifunctional 2-polyprenyl-6-hydroxyphenol methylase/3-demethylubiquinol 3-O-methyltransferase UbiG [Okeania sp. SIO1I7]|uniref:class I SAM-dependent methyltransferase n=1 Tax=Okeania sp. SIO1I7 TaxID=2607772 RepID=UPI0013F9A909|nr:class I SAM-dependent methyltransferase [Okeania sp. SIO1I7]NET24732.1 class I SAM-dependent methyltransferase [Okeania sp. SIO1I7]
MTHQDFLSTLAKHYGLQSVEQMLALDQKPTYAMNTNMRGTKLLEKLQENLRRPLQGQKVIDIGCAYGGITIELARAGAEVIGVDIIPSYLTLARENAKNDVDVSFLLADVSKKKFIELVEEGSIDIIVASDVLEHIYDSAGLIFNFSKCLNADGIVYFKVPNGFSFAVIKREVHKGKFGLSLLDPDCWHYFIEGRPRIYYRRWDYFQAIFSHFGFNSFKVIKDCSKLDSSLSVKHNVKKGLEEILEIYKAQNFESAIQSELMEEQINFYKDEVLDDLKNLDSDQLEFKYLINFWEVIFSKQDKILEPNNVSKLRQVSNRVYVNDYVFLENKSVQLTSKPIWISASVSPNEEYYLKGKIYSELVSPNHVLVQIRFLDDESTLLSPPYQGISFSALPDVGAYRYIPIKKSGWSGFTVPFTTPALAKSIELGFRSWKVKSNSLSLEPAIEIGRKSQE